MTVVHSESFGGLLHFCQSNAIGCEYLKKLVRIMGNGIGALVPQHRLGAVAPSYADCGKSAVFCGTHVDMRIADKRRLALLHAKRFKHCKRGCGVGLRLIRPLPYYGIKIIFAEKLFRKRNGNLNRVSIFSDKT